MMNLLHDLIVQAVVNMKLSGVDTVDLLQQHTHALHVRLQDQIRLWQML